MRRIRSRRRVRPRTVPLAIFVFSLALAFVLGVGLAQIWPLLFEAKPWLAENVQSSSVHIAAVRADDVGILCDLTVQVIPNGEGRILVDTYPLHGFDFQYSHWIAVEVAAAQVNVTLDDDGIGLKGADVLFKVSPPGGEAVVVQAIDGPSAGAAATVATIAALENRKVRDDVVLTGTIGKDGSIGLVGGIFKKAEAAHKAGASLFLVPPGQSTITSYRWVEVVPGFYTLQPVSIDLNEYAEQQGWGLEIREIQTIEEAVRLMLE